MSDGNAPSDLDRGEDDRVEGGIDRPGVDGEDPAERPDAGETTEGSPDSGATGPEDREADVEARAAALDEREAELDRREAELDDREGDLDAREAELEERSEAVLERREDAVDLREDLEERENELQQRAQSLDDREVALDERERELTEWADELDRKATTLSRYVGDQITEAERSISETVEESVSAAIAERHAASDASRLGKIGPLLLAIVGLVLVIGGVSNAFATEVGSVPTLFSSSAGNFGASAVLIFSGLAANLAAAAGRV